MPGHATPRAPYTIRLKPAATRDLKKIRDRDTLRRIAHAIDELALDPRPAGAEMLEGGKTPIFRKRVGDYRVIYSIDDDTLVILVIKIGDRKEVYRQLQRRR